MITLPPKKNIEAIVKEMLQEKGWDVTYKLKVTEEENPDLICASISKDYWDIQIITDPALEKKLEEHIKEEKLNTVNPLRKLFYTVSTHEEGHWSICPFDGIEYGVEILEGVTEGLKRSGVKKVLEGLESYALQTENMFCDIITNTTLALTEKRKEEWKEGRGLKYLLEAKKKKSIINHGSYSKGYALFVDCQMKLYQNNTYFKRLAEKFCKDYNKIRKDSERIVTTLTEEHITKKVFSGKPLEKEDEEYVARHVNDREKWRKKAETFAEIIAPYLEDMDEKISDNQFAQQMKNSPAFRKQAIQKGVEKGHNISYASPAEIMTETYKRVSEEIVIEFLKNEKESQKYELFYMTKERIKDDEMLERLAWEKTMFVNKGGEEELWLFKNKNPYTIEGPQHPGLGSVEDVLFIVDTSGSMSWSEQPLDNSKYDLAIRATFGTIKYLEKTGKAPYLNYGLIQFGTRKETTFTGWQNHSNIEALLEKMFTGYQNAGETILDSEKVEEALNTKRDNFTCIMTTDGELHNADEAVKTCKKMIIQGNDLMILQLQSRSTFAEEMKKHGAEVKNIDKPEDQIGLTLRKIKTKYTPE